MKNLTKYIKESIFDTDYTIDKKGLLDTFLSKDIVILPKKYIKLIELIHEKSK